MKTDISRLKTDVNLIQVAIDYGYQVDKKKSTKNSTKMKSGVDSIIINRSSDGHWIYFNTIDEGDKGSIVDFIRARETGMSFGHVLKKIRCVYCSSITDEEIFEVNRKVEKKNSAYELQASIDRLKKNISSMPFLVKSSYLESRYIDQCILSSNRFLGSIREDKYKNAVFPHIDRNGACGAEMRNFGFQGFTKTTRKTIWSSNRLLNDSTLFVCESAIDALSHQQLKNTHSTRYISIGGNPSRMTREIIMSMFMKFYEKGGKIVIGTDNDIDGDRLYGLLQSLVDFDLEREIPGQKDWNDDLASLLCVSTSNL